MQNPKATPLALLALLLFALPLLLTRQKFVELLAFGERSHQLAAEPTATKTELNPCCLFFRNSSRPVRQILVPLPVFLPDSCQQLRFLRDHRTPLLHGFPNPFAPFRVLPGLLVQ